MNKKSTKMIVNWTFPRVIYWISPTDWKRQLVKTWNNKIASIKMIKLMHPKKYSCIQTAQKKTKRFFNKKRKKHYKKSLIISIQMTFKRENKTSINLFSMLFVNPSLSSKDFKIKLQFSDREETLKVPQNLDRHKRRLKPTSCPISKT